MSNGTIKDYTPNFKLIIPQFNVATWHDYMEDNFRAIDAMFHNLFDIQQYKGVWKKLTSYEPKDVVFIGEDKIINADGVEVDSDFSGRLYKVKVYHTTETQSDNFSEYYAQHPEYYEPLLDTSIIEQLKSETEFARDVAISAKDEASMFAISAKNSELATKDAINKIKYPIRYQNVVIPFNLWQQTDKYSSYPYEAHVVFKEATTDFIPTAIFDVDLSTSGLIAPVLEAFDGYVAFYAKDALQNDITVQSVILSDTSDKTYEGDIDLTTKADINGENFAGSVLEDKIDANIDKKIAETVPQIHVLDKTGGEIALETNKIYNCVINTDTLFKFPAIVGTLIHNQIKVMVKVEEDVNIDFETSYYFNKIKPTLTKGFYDVYFDYDNLLNAWVCGAISKGAND
ncbi:MAG: hypothetical protein IKT40_01125 [Bacilli bacterium]|nr:hypothetical protein [Bacilli bacterium]